MNWVIICPGNGLSQGIRLSPIRHQAITGTNCDLLSIGLLETYFSEIWTGIPSFLFNKMQLKMPSVYTVAMMSRGDELKGPQNVPYWHNVMINSNELSLLFHSLYTLLPDIIPMCRL